MVVDLKMRYPPEKYHSRGNETNLPWQWFDRGSSVASLEYHRVPTMHPSDGPIPISAVVRFFSDPINSEMDRTRLPLPSKERQRERERREREREMDRSMDGWMDG